MIQAGIGAWQAQGGQGAVVKHCTAAMSGQCNSEEVIEESYMDDITHANVVFLPYIIAMILATIVVVVRLYIVLHLVGSQHHGL